VAIRARRGAPDRRRVCQIPCWVRQRKRCSVVRRSRRPIGRREGNRYIGFPPCRDLRQIKWKRCLSLATSPPISSIGRGFNKLDEFANA